MSQFEQENKAAETLFENKLSLDETETPVEEQSNETENSDSIQVPEEENKTEEQLKNEALENAVSTAERGAQVAVQQDAQIKQLQEQLQQAQAANQNLTEQNQTLNNAITQMNQVQQEKVVEETLEMPTIDFSALVYDNEEEATARQKKYADDMREYVRRDVMKELEPFVAQAKEGLYQKEKEQTLNDLSKVPEMKGIAEVVPQLDAIINRNSILQRDDVSMAEKYILAYTIMKGVDSINKPETEPTAQELMDLYEKNTEFQEMIETKRVQSAKPNQQVPPLSASSGAVNAALNIPEKPKTIEEAHERARKLFGR